MDGNRLHQLDSQFVEFYEAARNALVEAQKRKALIVVQDDMMLLYHRDLPVLEFPGLRPALYTKLKTIGHMPLAIYCLLREHAGTQKLPEAVGAKLAAYRDELKALPAKSICKKRWTRDGWPGGLRFPAARSTFLTRCCPGKRCQNPN
jgi:hypothetical protein